MEVNDKVTLVEKVTNQFFLDLLMNEVLMLIGTFTLGQCFAYYLLKREKKTQKEEIDCFFKNYEKKHGLQQSGSCRKNERD